MEFKIHGHNLEITEALASHVEDRFYAALSQHDDRVGEIAVTLSDENGPKGGVDMKCHAVVHLKPRGTLVIEELKDDMYAAVSLAADRAKHAVSRELERRREK